MIYDKTHPCNMLLQAAVLFVWLFLLTGFKEIVVIRVLDMEKFKLITFSNGY